MQATFCIILCITLWLLTGSFAETVVLGSWFVKSDATTLMRHVGSRHPSVSKIKRMTPKYSSQARSITV